MLLINPAQENFGGMLSRYIPLSIPVALGILASYLKKSGASNVRVVDEEICKITAQNLTDHLKGMAKPYIIGIGVLTSQAGRAYEIARICKETLPDCIVIMGGIHVTSLPEEPFEAGCVDIVVRGEGEETLRQLYFCLRKGKDWKKIKGITFRNKEGKLVNNPDGDLIENIDDLPMFPYEMFSHPKYEMGFITSARGCPYKCSYCSQRLSTGLTYRWHSESRIVETLKILIEKYNQKYILFFDDNFSVNKQRVIKLCESIVQAGLHEKCSFGVQTRADNLYEDLIPAMKRANFTTVTFGMETGVERVAEAMVKDETVAIHQEKIELCQKHGIKVRLAMIYGFPTETRAERNESYRVVKETGAKWVKFNNLTPYPGTGVYAEAKKSGRLNIMPGWANFNSVLGVTKSIFSTIPLPYVPEGTTEFELKKDLFRRNLQFYLSSKIARRVAKGGREGGGWLVLPKLWYLRPKEIFHVSWLALFLGSNLIFSLLPDRLGNVIFSLIKRGRSIFPPEDIKATSRSFVRAATPNVSESY